MNRNFLALILLIVSISAFIYYFSQKPSPDIEFKGPLDHIDRIVSLLTGIIGLVTAIITYKSKRQEQHEKKRKGGK